MCCRAPAASCIELTALVIPATLFFSTAAMLVPKPSDRALAPTPLNVVAAIYFVKAGWWMISPGVLGVAATRIDDHGICRQSTGYTCVWRPRWSRCYGPEESRPKKPRWRLCAAHSRAGAKRHCGALARHMQARRPAVQAHVRPSRSRIAARVPKPCMVQLDWGFFVSHMVPVMSATPDGVVIGDPLSGVREVPMADFLKDWKGMAITLEDAGK